MRNCALGGDGVEGLRKTALSRYTFAAIATNIPRNRHEFSVAVFTAHGRSLPAPPSRGDGAADADAGGEAFAGAAAAERRILCAARHAGWPDHRGSLAGHDVGLWQPGRTRHLFASADRGMAWGRRCRSRQRRIDLSPALACRARLAFLVPAGRRIAGRAVGGADFAGPEDDDGRRKGHDLRDAARAGDRRNT